MKVLRLILLGLLVFGVAGCMQQNATEDLKAGHDHSQHEIHNLTADSEPCSLSDVINMVPTKIEITRTHDDQKIVYENENDINAFLEKIDEIKLYVDNAELCTVGVDHYMITFYDQEENTVVVKDFESILVEYNKKAAGTFKGQSIFSVQKTIGEQVNFTNLLEPLFEK